MLVVRGRMPGGLAPFLNGELNAWILDQLATVSGDPGWPSPPPGHPGGPGQGGHGGGHGGGTGGGHGGKPSPHGSQTD